VYQNVLARYQEFLEKKTNEKIAPTRAGLTIRPLLKEEAKESEPQKDLKSTTSEYCDTCGEPNAPGTQYCIYCGRILSRRSRAPQQQVSEVPAVPDADEEEIVKQVDTQPLLADSDKKISPSLEQTQKDGIFRVSKDFSPKSDQESQTPQIIQKNGIARWRKIAPIDDKQPTEHQIEKQSTLKSLQETQIEISKHITRRTAIIGICSFSLALLLIIILSQQRGIDRIAVGLILLSFLSTVLSLVYDILKGRNYTEWSALGATISYFGIFFIFIPLIFYVILPEGINDVLVFITEAIGILLLVIGVTLRWTEYDEKLVNLITIAIGYWKNYQKREAIKTFFRAIRTFFSGLFRSILGGISRFPKRLWTFLGMIRHSFVVYVKTTIGQLISAFTRIFKGFWNYMHWFGLLAILAYLGLSYLSSDQNIGTFMSYQNIEILIIISFFFALGILFSNSERIVKVVSNTRIAILKGAISAYSMLSGAKIKKEDSLFCSRCLRGVHKIEFAELQHVEDTETPLCPFCGYVNWVSVS
jgi:hypothetical protein